MWREDLTSTTSTIVSGINTWLSAEYASASAGGNQYLDDLRTLQEGLKLDSKDPKNFNAIKRESHHMRHRVWLEPFLADPMNDKASALILFNILMQMSGTHRALCYLASTTMEQYYETRHGANASGIALPDFVEGITERYAKSPMKTPNQVARIGLHVFKLMRISQDYLTERAQLDTGLASSPLITNTRQLQASWAEIATEHILLAADLREGELPRVPVLEPKSISEDPKIIYPFAA